MGLPGPLVREMLYYFFSQGRIKLIAFSWLKCRAVFLHVCAISVKDARDRLLGQQGEGRFGSHFLPRSSSLLCTERAHVPLFPALR